MAAAALLRSMARKLARAPPPHLLAGGLARSGPGASSPPLTSNQIRQLSGDPLVVGAGLRSGAALSSLATKVARAPPQPHHRHILNRRLHSGGTDKDKIIEDLRRELRLAKAVAFIGGLVLIGVTIYGEFWMMPKLEKMKNKSVAFDRLVRQLRGADEDNERGSVALAEIIQTLGHMRQQSNGTTEKGTRVDKLEEGDLMPLSLDMLKEALANLKEMRADMKEFRAATAQMSKSAPLEQKEGCSREGSEAVSS